ncbi:PREDICTED: putative E3 ubiquitin-protein ligase SINA-like 6 [Ipomoea nil]|uniref:putative E3 ubiquitin-protein ligase SINA-like 6 n=1 Tax=Ipomoea nil TaxID=35883 RepID=UPI000901C1F4|nr:PREDICTED: putative E3 ubiquitin-protein ligase SINA-like 6 [Ipomoea nil]
MKNCSKASIKGSGADSVSRRSAAYARMTKFSLFEDDLGAGPSTRSPSLLPTPKKRRTVPSKPSPEPEPEEIEAEDEEEEEVEVEEGEAEEEEEEEDDEDGREEMVPGSDDFTETDRGSEDQSGNGSVYVQLTDPDVLDCPICFDSLTIPVFQCENGHVACASCCIHISNKCPSCAWPIGYNRCRALEKVLESVKVRCPNAKYGCKESLIYSNQNEHLSTCIYAPCSCPLQSCNFLGFSREVYTHFSRHSSSAKCFIFNSPKLLSVENHQRFIYLQELTTRTIFVVNHNDESSLGSAINIICVAPQSSKRSFCYKLIVWDGDTTFELQSLAENVPDWSPFTPMKIFLVVPSDITETRDQLMLQVCINDK